MGEGSGAYRPAVRGIAAWRMQMRRVAMSSGEVGHVVRKMRVGVCGVR